MRILFTFYGDNMKKTIYLLSTFIALLLIFINVNVKADTYLSDKTETTYDAKSGLLTGTANTIIQSDNGYIWIGQYAGLTRYDGKNFTTFTKYNDCDITGVMSLDSVDNEVYIGTQKGLFCYQNKTFRKIDFANATFCVYAIDIYKNKVYVASDIGLLLYDRYTKQITSLDNKNTIDVNVDGDLCYYLTDSGSVYKVGFKNVSYYDKTPIRSIYLKDNVLYLGQKDGVLVVKDDKSERSIDISDRSINDIIMRDDTIYIATDNGLYLYDPATDISKSAGSLKNETSIQDIMFDYEGNLWVASSKTGISKISQNDLSDYLYDYNLSKISVNAIEKYKNLMYIATDNAGLYIIDDVKHMLVNNELTNMLASIRIRDLAVYNDKLYIATYDTQTYDLICYDGENITDIKADEISMDEVSSKAGDIRCLDVADGALFVGSNYGISKYLNDTFVSKVKFENGNRPLYLYHHGDDLYAVVENIGINILNYDLKNIRRIDDENHSTLKCLYVNDMLVFNDNNFLYYYKNGVLTKSNLDLMGSIVEIIYLKDKYYICTDNYIYVIDDITSEVINPKILDESNGLKSALVANASGYYDEAKNNYYLAASEGIYVLNTDKLIHSKPKIKIEINDISIDGVSAGYGDVRIAKNAQRLKIDFAVLTFSLDNKFNVYYKLDGLEDEYHKITGNDPFTISYTNLAGGDYKLNIYVEDSEGQRGYNDISVSIVKEKKFIEYPIFWVILIILSVFIIAFIAFLIAKIQLNRVRRRAKEFERITNESIFAIAKTIDAKDKYTNGHSVRVGYYSRQIAKELNMSDDEVERIYYIALLHDIGKVAIPDNILNKNGRLTDEEFSIMKTHVTEGTKILKDITTIEGMSDGAHYHHEHYDGTGYPEGLKGEEIPYIARIICCADCYDAMSTKRSYKEPYTKEKILSEFERCKGTQFDPEIAELVIKLIKEDKFNPEDAEKRQDI